MKKDGYILQDKHGHVRVPENIKINDAHRVADMMFQCSGKDIGVKELDVSFAEYDEANGTRRKSGGERWTRDQEKFYILNADLDNDTLARKMNEKFATNRSGYAIKMKYDSIIRPFDTWYDARKKSFVAGGLGREEAVTLYMAGDDMPEDE